MQLWCNQRGKDGLPGLNGQLFVHTIESVDGNYPHKRCVQSPHRIRSQEFILSSIRGANAYRRTYPSSCGCVRGYYAAGSFIVNFGLMSEIIMEGVSCLSNPMPYCGYDRS